MEGRRILNLGRSWRHQRALTRTAQWPGRTSASRHSLTWLDSRLTLRLWAAVSTGMLRGSATTYANTGASARSPSETAGPARPTCTPGGTAVASFAARQSPEGLSTTRSDLVSSALLVRRPLSGTEASRLTLRPGRGSSGSNPSASDFANGDVQAPVRRVKQKAARVAESNIEMPPPARPIPEADEFIAQINDQEARLKDDAKSRLQSAAKPGRSLKRKGRRKRADWP